MSKIRLFGTSSGQVEIAPAAAASNNTLTAPSTVGEIIAKDAAGAIGITSMKASNVNVGAAVTITESGIEASGIGITCANINGTQIGGRRNLIINGAMQIAQRGTSATSSGYVVDRFRPHWNGTDESPTQAQVTLTSAVGPYLEGHRKSLRITNGNQTTSPAVDDYIIIETKIEAQDIASSGWNYTSTSSFITLSFWVKSSVAQNFYGLIRSIDGTSQAFPIETGSLTADTWKKVIYKIPGNSNLTFDNDSNHGLNIRIVPFRGTDATGSVTLGQWGAFNSSVQYPDNTTTWYTTNDATFSITGLQLEVGSQVTPFEHRSFAEELNLCKRYYQKSYAYGTAPGTTNSFLNQLIGRAYASVSNRMELNTRFEVEMRTTPTMTTYTPSGGTSGDVEDYSSGNGTAAGTARDVSAVRNTGNKGFGGITVSSPQDGVLGLHYTADAEM